MSDEDKDGTGEGDHVFIRLTTASGSPYILDLTSAQFGISLNDAVPYAIYREQYATGTILQNYEFRVKPGKTWKLGGAAEVDGKRFDTFNRYYQPYVRQYFRKIKDTLTGIGSDDSKKKVLVERIDLDKSAMFVLPTSFAGAVTACRWMPSLGSSDRIRLRCGVKERWFRILSGGRFYGFMVVVSHYNCI